MRSPAPTVTVLEAPRAARWVIIVQAKFLPSLPVRSPESIRPWKSLTVSRLTGVDPAGMGPLVAAVAGLAAMLVPTRARPESAAPTFACCFMSPP